MMEKDISANLYQKCLPIVRIHTCISSTVATFYEQRVSTCKSYHKTQLRKILQDFSGHNFLYLQRLLFFDIC